MTIRFAQQIFRLESAHAILPKLKIGRTTVDGGIIRVEIVNPNAVPGDDEAWVSEGTNLAGYLEEIGHKILGTCTAQYGTKGNGPAILTDPVVIEQLNRLRREVRRTVKSAASTREASRKKAAVAEMRRLVDRCGSKYKLPKSVVREIFIEALDMSVVEEVMKS